MIRKAIIEEAVSPTLYRIRIPEIDGVKGYVFDTPFQQLHVAPICCPPNQIPNYLVGDVVYIAYEKNDDPVIIGKLLTEKVDNTFPDISTNSLKVNGEITIGDTQRKDLLNLSGTIGNLQEQINNLQSQIDALREQGE